MNEAMTLDDAMAVIDFLNGADDLPIGGLSPQQSQIVRILERARGGFRTTENILYSLNFTNPNCTTDKKTLAVQVHNVKRRRPDIALRLFSHRGFGYRLAPGVVA